VLAEQEEQNKKSKQRKTEQRIKNKIFKENKSKSSLLLCPHTLSSNFNFHVRKNGVRLGVKNAESKKSDANRQ